tara:strand:- start:409 stop:516 length:108 start_codon:yes stop_codon:yes gene_type:complete
MAVGQDSGQSGEAGQNKQERHGAGLHYPGGRCDDA